MSSYVKIDNSTWKEISAIKTKIDNSVWRNFSTIKLKMNNSYEEIEYIESSGTQYIDTGIKPNNNTRIIIDVDILSTSPSTSAIFGGRSSQSSNSFGLWKISSSAFRCDYNSRNSGNITSNTPTGRYLIDYNKNELFINEASVYTFTSATFESNCNLTLFAFNTNNSPDSRRIYGKLYSCKIYNSDVLIRDLIPVKNSKDEYGMLDIINNAFYKSSSGNFSGGNKTGNEILVSKWIEI